MQRFPAFIALFSLVPLAAATVPACGGDSSSGQTESDASIGGVADVSAADALPADVAADVPTLPDATPSDTPDTPDVTATGSGLFTGGCPVPGTATARMLASADEKAWGTDALGTEGDLLLLNEHAAFVILGAEAFSAWWAYGGIIVDAVAVEGCDQAGPERFGEIAWLLGQLDLLDFRGGSVLRGFRADTVEVVADGSDGRPAIVRATGADDRFWLVEQTLINEAFSAGGGKALSDPLEVDVVIDYILRPGAKALEIELTLRNRGVEPKEMLIGSIFQLGETMQSEIYAFEVLEIGGLSLDVELPWVAASSGDAAWAIGIPGATAGTFSVAGTRTLTDIRQGIEPLELAPAGEEGDSLTEHIVLAVAAGSTNSATRLLHAYDPEPIPNTPYEPMPVVGRVVDDLGTPLAGVDVVVELLRADGSNGGRLDGMLTDAEGRFEGALARFSGFDERYRLRPRREGWPAAEPTPLDLTARTDIELVLARPGRLKHDIRDSAGASLPAKIGLYQGNARKRLVYAAGAPGEADVPPGTYSVSVTRGFEYAPHEGEVVIAAGGATELNVTLDRVVDTSGFMSTDTHVHAKYSPDSVVPLVTRMISYAAEGVELPVSTEHDAIADWLPAVAEAGLEDWITTVPGSEVTATLPEHHNAIGVWPTYDHDARGDRVRWYGLDIAELHAAMRQRGVPIIQLNHPGWMNTIGYDPMTGEATLEDPTRLGFEADAALWSWALDAIEYQNGNDVVFDKPDSDPSAGGVLVDWLSFHNHGHTVTALGVTDTHGVEGGGSPRSYFAAATDAPAELDHQAYIAAILAQRVVVSTGAFARVSVGDAGVGQQVTAGGVTVELKVHIEALPAIDVTHFLVLANCDEVAKVAASAPDEVVKYDGTLSLSLGDADAYIVVLGFGDRKAPRGLSQFNPKHVPRFTTNPIYVDRDGDGVFTAPGGKACSFTIDAPAAE